MLDQFCNFFFSHFISISSNTETQGTTKVVEMRGVGSSGRNKCLKMTEMIRKQEQMLTYLASKRQDRKLLLKHCLDLPKGKKNLS